jgi:hypothetical protein
MPWPQWETECQALTTSGGAGCRKYLRRPVVINIGAAGKATDNVTQRVVVSVVTSLACSLYSGAIQ